MSATIAIASAPMPPAPMPWMKRATRSCSIEPAAPQSIEPTVKIEIAVMYTRLRP
jgi:hypothetical protein